MRVWRKALHREEWQPWFAWYPVDAGGSLIWLKWIERCRCYAVIDEWWEVRLPDGEGAGQKSAAHRTEPERRGVLAVSAENSYAIGAHEERAMALTGKFKFRKALWGKIVLQIEEEVKPFWSRSKPPALQRRWRDTTLMDLAAPEMRTLIDIRLRPHLRSQGSTVSEATTAHHEQHKANGVVEAQAPHPNGRITATDKKRHTPEEIISKLRQFDVLVAQGTPVANAIRAGRAQDRGQP